MGRRAASFIPLFYLTTSRPFATARSLRVSFPPLQTSNPSLRDGSRERASFYWESGKTPPASSQDRNLLHSNQLFPIPTRSPHPSLAGCLSDNMHSANERHVMGAYDAQSIHRIPATANPSNHQRQLASPVHGYRFLPTYLLPRPADSPVDIPSACERAGIQFFDITSRQRYSVRSLPAPFLFHRERVPLEQAAP